MLNVIISGCSGYMGHVLTNLIKEDKELNAAAGIDKNPADRCEYPVYSSFEDCDVNADVIIDFSHPSALDSILNYAVNNKCALVLAVTGYTDEQNAKVKKAAQSIPVFQSGSMSLGINLLKKLLKQAAASLGNEFDIEIVERHHNRKLDAPSGTALLLADAINESMDEPKTYNLGRNREIGIHAVRGGTIVGEHQIIFAGNDEIIEFKHTSLSRNIFAVGAIRAAKYICKQNPGYYNMDDML